MPSHERGDRAAIFREWVVNVGRRESLNALAHVMCEFVIRMRIMGLSDGEECELPMTQAELGDRWASRPCTSTALSRNSEHAG